MNSPKDLPPLGDWVKAWAKRYGHTGAMQQELLRNTWEQIVGPALASRTHALRWDGGSIVWVRMGDAASQQEVHLRQREWLDALRVGEERAHLKEIRTY
ncbi:MAG: DUF721 domain-containing protein [Bacteroidetes bacterium]|jgi:hypothetical protein|nr:DUF721 domain-containing protein [Bacteroidota bacterium]